MMYELMIESLSRDAIRLRVGNAIGELVTIGCKNHALADWLEHYDQIGLENGYSEAQIEEYGGYLRKMAEVARVMRGVEKKKVVKKKAAKKVVKKPAKRIKK